MLRGAALFTQFGRTDDPADLDAAIDADQRAVDITPPGHPDLPAILSNLGITLRVRFGRSGDTADLDAAINAGQRAVDLTPPGHPDLAGQLAALGNSLRARFERSGDTADLDAAIDAGQRAVDLTPPGHPDLAWRLAVLGNSLRARFERSGDTADLDAAIDAGQRAVDLTPPGHPDLASSLADLGATLYAQFERSGDTADLDAAIDAGRRAVDLTPSGDPDFLSNLGGALTTRFRQRAQFDQAAAAADLDAGIDAGRRAVDLTLPGHPQLAAYLLNLGVSLLDRFKHADDTADLEAAIACWRRASELPTAAPGIRLGAAMRWGAAAADAKRARVAAKGFAVAVGLLPTAAWHGLDRATREDQLAQAGGLAVDAAACAILDARPALAVELLEQGRSVMWTQALNLRNDSDIARLAQKAPDLAGQLDRIRVILNDPGSELPRSGIAAGLDLDHGWRQQAETELRRHMATEWDEVLAKVRALRGFEHFLAAIPYQDLKAAATSGPVVIVNASRYGCHALVVDCSSEQPHVVSLPDLSFDSAIDQANKMLRALEGAADPRRAFKDREKVRRAVLDILDWLWDVIAEPVLTALGHMSTPGIASGWPRVWWCPTGPLTVLPIHAAGHHPRLRTAATATDCVLDRVISSYTPTLTALSRARQPSAHAQVRQLTVGMPNTPGLRSLPAVSAELKVLADRFPSGPDNHQLAGVHATRTATLEAIGTHSWVHLACHANQQHANPARSGFVLWDATLTITDLAAQPTRDRELAFLSACQTATGSVRNLDEAIHLAAAMQFLGYRDVIATMWTIADSRAPHVADMFYAALTRDGRPDPGRAAEALHHAVCSLRQTDPTYPLLWAPYIHHGT